MIFRWSGQNKISEVSQVFFLKNDPPGKSWKNNFSGIPWNQGPSGPPLAARAPNSVQDSLNESSVRPNGTSVMPVLRSRAGQKSGLVKNPGWSKICVNLTGGKKPEPHTRAQENCSRISAEISDFSPVLQFLCKFNLYCYFLFSGVPQTNESFGKKQGRGRLIT